MSGRNYRGINADRVKTRIRLFDFLTKFFALTAAVAFGSIVIAKAVPQYRELREQTAVLEQIKKQEEEILALKEVHEIQLHALREDTSYLEMKARDPLNYYTPGERILRFEK